MMNAAGSIGATSSILKSFRLQLHALHASRPGTLEPARSFLLQRYLTNAGHAHR
jgi:hypothetical protein